MFVTEYGVADLHGKNDRDRILAMIALADAEFQEGLLEQARKAGKVERKYRRPEAPNINRPQTISNALASAQKAGHCSAFPFASDFTEVEQRLVRALSLLKRDTASLSGLAHTLVRAVLARSNA